MEHISQSENQRDRNKKQCVQHSHVPQNIGINHVSLCLLQLDPSPRLSFAGWANVGHVPSQWPRRSISYPRHMTVRSVTTKVWQSLAHQECQNGPTSLPCHGSPTPPPPKGRIWPLARAVALLYVDPTQSSETGTVQGPVGTKT